MAQAPPIWQMTTIKLYIQSHPLEGDGGRRRMNLIASHLLLLFKTISLLALRKTSPDLHSNQFNPRKLP